jgi:hypothetical protein
MERMAELCRQLYNVSSPGMRFFSVYGAEGDGQEAIGQHGYSVPPRNADGKATVIFGDGLQTSCRKQSNILETRTSEIFERNSDFHVE